MSEKKHTNRFFNYLFLLSGLILLAGCGGDTQQKNPETIVNDSRFSEYIKAYTSGTISQKQNITIQFSEQISIPADLTVDKLFSIEPSLKGTLVKTDPHTIVLSPEKNLSSGQTFLFTLKLDALTDVPEALEKFRFRVSVIQQDFDLQLSPVEVSDPANPDVLTFTGIISTADFTENEAVEKMISLPEDLTLTWQHISPTSHRFTVSGIERQDNPRTLAVKASGKPIGVNRASDHQVVIPSAQLFSLISTKVELGRDGHVSVYFTDPLDAQQNLKGLIQLEGVNNPRITVAGNELKLYVPDDMNGSKKLEISEGIRNTKGKTLGQSISTYVAFEPEKPQVRLVGNGTILPSTNGLVLPFESVNLKSLQVEVVKVYEENLPQFFQVNSLSGNEQLVRVGQKVWKQQISLAEKADNLSSWNRFTLDLADVFTSEKGALYQVRIGFRPEDTTYPCTQAVEAQEQSETTENWNIYQPDGFNAWGSLLDYYYPNGYSWTQRDNPCHVSYYVPDRFATVSLLASDIGLITKIGADNVMTVIATDMTTAQPLQASVKVLDYQLQELGTLTTDAEGKASFVPDRRPFLIIAESAGQKSYLKLDDNASLSMSNFDVAGSRIVGNVKGFIYGDRGVWRPGEDIFLSFMLQDADQKIPADHPVVMELRDPRGNLKDKQVLTHGVSGLYTFRTKTDTEDITGNWMAAISLGNHFFSKVVKVETIKPNRLKIELDLGSDRVTPENRAIAATLQVNWLTGIKGSDLQVETEAKIEETNTTFDGYGQYEFDDQGKSFYLDPYEVFSGQTSQDGSASFNVSLPSNPKTPGALKATFTTKAFEPGGSFSIHSKAITYLPYESFVGLNLTTAKEGNRIERDQPQQFQVVTLDAKGNPVNRENLEFQLYKLNWRWWWDEAEDYSVNYVSSHYSTLVERRKFTTTQGKGTLDFVIKSPEWGRFIAVVRDPVSGHSASQVFYTSWYGDDGGSSLGASSLEISTNKKTYETGDKIQVTIKGSQTGQALVSVENGSSVLKSFWVQTDQALTTFSLEATPEMAPNVYLNISLLQPHGQTTNDLPVRLYGVTSVQVLDKKTRLNPVIKMADELAPNKPVEIVVSESNGKPMAYTLAIVDEGLLDITNFKTPAPWDHFYSKEAIGVKTWDIYDDVIGAYGGKLERLLAIGGGEGGEDNNTRPRENRFKPVVQFTGPFYLDKRKSKKHTFTMPQYIGSVRTMVVAGLDGAYGSAERATPVIQPLMVLGTLPRVVGPGEKVSLPVNVFRYSDQIKNAQVTVEASGVLKATGSNSQTLQLDQESGTLYFDIEVADAPGDGKVTITGSSGKESANHEIHIVSRAPNTPQTVTELFPVEAGKAVQSQVKLFGMDETNEVSLEIASIPPINLERRLQYLISYPHGCIEQTVSSAFPQLFLSEITRLSEEQRVKLESNVKRAIEKIAKFQEPGGGLSYWPGSSEADAWSTNYAYHFLIEAQKQGYLVSGELMDKLRNFQRSRARNWTKSVDHRDSDLIQAYRLFTLTAGGYPELGAMNRLRNTSGKSIQSTYKLASAYALVGQTEAARELMNGTDMATLKKQSDTDHYRYSYGSLERDLAILLETYVYMNRQTEAFKVLKEISQKLTDDDWMSTQTTAYALLAVSKYIAANNAGENLKANVSYGSTETTWESDRAIVRSPVTITNGETLTITNVGKGNLFATLTITGTPAPGKEPVAKSGLDIQLNYVDINGRPVNPDSLKLGESFDVLVTVKNEYAYGYIDNIALTHIIPSGWEIRNDRLNNQESGGTGTFDYQDIRDDRVYTYFGLERNERKTFRLNVTAAYPGSYYMPGVHAEAMYKAGITAKTAGKWITIRE